MQASSADHPSSPVEQEALNIAVSERPGSLLASGRLGQALATAGIAFKQVLLEDHDGMPALQGALMAGQVDVCSIDHHRLPTQQPEGVLVGGVSKRRSPGDCLLVPPELEDPEQLFGVQQGAKVVYRSCAQAMQLAAYRPDLELVKGADAFPDRWARALEASPKAALLGALAESEQHASTTSTWRTERLLPEHVVPAPAQGVDAYLWRKGDQQTSGAMAALHHPDTVLALRAERKLLASLQATVEQGAERPMEEMAFAAYCREDEGLFHFHIACGEPLFMDGQASDKDFGQAIPRFPRRLWLKHFDPEVLVVEAWHKLRAPAPERVFISKTLPAFGVFARGMHAHGIQVQAADLTREDLEVPSPERAILTDAANAAAYLERFPERKQDVLIAADQSTLKALRQAGAGRVFRSRTADAMALVEAVFSA